MLERISSPGAGPDAIQAHYDTGDAFFALFLDETRTYSCALFDDAAALEDAQRAKLDWHLNQARLPRGGRLLDVGCGWGAALRRAIERYDAGEAVGLTLSHAQAAYCAAGDARIRVHLEDWADHDRDACYDAVISIGAFEHFARPGASARDRIQAYTAFFDQVAGWLPPGGRLTLQTMAYPEGFDRDAYDRSQFGAFVRERIFPESDLPALTEILLAASAHFDLTTLRNDRRHYATTLRHWRRRLNARRADAESLVGPARVEEFDRYFKISTACFEIGTLLLLRLVFERRPLSAGVRPHA